MPIRPPVLVATDLSEAADEALRQADRLARQLGGTLQVCHVLPEIVRVRMLFPQLQQRDTDEMQTLAGTASAVVAAHVGKLVGRAASEYEVRVEEGSPHAGILHAAEKAGAGIVVLGPGDVALRVARSAGCPVLVARPSPAGSVLGATDFSDPSLPAVEAAVREAARRGVPLGLMHSVDLSPIESAAMPAAFPVPAVPKGVVDELRQDALLRLRACLDRFGARGELRVGDGPAAPAIVKAARELPAELLVVGTRGRTGLRRLALGSVAEAVLAGAGCSVLVVRLGDA